MYIRRKVFSALVDESGEQKLFSTTDYVLDQHMYAEETALTEVAVENTAKGKRKILDALKANKVKVVEWAKKNPKTAIAVGAGTVGVGTVGALALRNRKKKRQEEKSFSAKSKALAILAPGSYQAKEALKYAYDPENAEDVAEYKKKRGGYALKGFFTPVTASVIKKKAEKMAKEGKSKEEIREYLENGGGKARVLGGIGEVAANSASYYAPKGLSTVVNGARKIKKVGVRGVQVADKLTKNRAWDKKNEK